MAITKEVLDELLKEIAVPRDRDGDFEPKIAGKTSKGMAWVR